MADVTNFRLSAGDFGVYGSDLSRPECVLAEADGTVWVSDDRGAVTRIAPDGKQTLIGSMRAAPNGLAMDRAGAIFIAMFVATKKMAFFTQASYDRAKMLAEQSGLTDEALILIDLSYGEITEDEANHRLNELRERE